MTTSITHAVEGANGAVAVLAACCVCMRRDWHSAWCCELALCRSWEEASTDGSLPSLRTTPLMMLAWIGPTRACRKAGAQRAVSRRGSERSQSSRRPHSCGDPKPIPRQSGLIFEEI